MTRLVSVISINKIKLKISGSFPTKNYLLTHFLSFLNTACKKVLLLFLKTNCTFRFECPPTVRGTKNLVISFASTDVRQWQSTQWLVDVIPTTKRHEEQEPGVGNMAATVWAACTTLMLHLKETDVKVNDIFTSIVFINDRRNGQVVYLPHSTYEEFKY